MALDLRPQRLPLSVDAPSAPLGLWRSYRTARRNVLELIPAAAYREPELVDIQRGRWIMLMDPAAIDQVMRSHAEQYP